MFAEIEQGWWVYFPKNSKFNFFYDFLLLYGRYVVGQQNTHTKQTKVLQIYEFRETKPQQT